MTAIFTEDLLTFKTIMSITMFEEMISKFWGAGDRAHGLLKENRICKKFYAIPYIVISREVKH